MSGDALTFASVYREMTGPGGLQAGTVRSAFDAIFSGRWTPAPMFIVWA